MKQKYPLWVYVVTSTLLLLAVSIFIRLIAVGLGWANIPANVLTAKEAQAQVTDLTEQYNQLSALVVNLKSYEAEMAAIEARNAGYEDQLQWSSADRTAWSQWNRQMTVARGEFNRRCGNYNAKWDNFFESGAAKLYGLNDKIPTRCEMSGFGN